MKRFPDDPSIHMGYITSDDTTCWIVCECGHDIEEIISDSEITRCPSCGLGYKTEFVVWQFEKDEEE